LGLPAALSILGLLLAGPLLIRQIEENLEAYCLALGLLAILLAGGGNWMLAKKALRDPVPIAAAVVVAGILFRYGRGHLDRLLEWACSRIGRPALAGATVTVTAVASSIITSIVAALILVEALRRLRLPRAQLVPAVVAGCLAIGLGASLTPLGEPLSTIAVEALDLEFFGLFSLLAPYVLPGIGVCALLVAFCSRGSRTEVHLVDAEADSLGAIALRGVKVFGFIAGLILLGEAFAPLAKDYIHFLSAPALFWANVVGAALDNATVIAIEVHGTPLPLAREIILSLLASGAMLIQGNIPNIIAAGALNISAVQWSKIGIPLGLIFLLGYFAALHLI
jgi:predicted cation transporter